MNMNKNKAGIVNCSGYFRFKEDYLLLSVYSYLNISVTG